MLPSSSVHVYFMNSLGFSVWYWVKRPGCASPKEGPWGWSYCSLQGSLKDTKSLRKRNRAHSLFHLKINQLNQRKWGRWLVSQAPLIAGRAQALIHQQTQAIVPACLRTGRRSWSQHPDSHHPSTLLHPVLEQGTRNLGRTYRCKHKAKIFPHFVLLSWCLTTCLLH